MPRALRTRAAAWAVVALPGFFASTARATDKMVCLAAHEGAQRDRQENRLLVAREKLLKCSDGGCPQAVRDDCAAWLTFLDQEVPTLMIEARDEGGTVLSDVSVFDNDVRVAARLDGHGIRFDPGRHVLRFQHPPHLPVLRSVTLGRGDNARLLFVSFVPFAKSTGGTAAPRESVAIPSSAPRSSVWPIVLGGAAAASLATSVVLGLGVHRDRESCRPCTAEQSSAFERRLWAADVPLAAGVILSGIATWMLLAPTAGPAAASADVVESPPSFEVPRGVAALRCAAETR